MSLSRVLSSIQQAVLSHGRIAPAVYPFSPLQVAVQRWYASGYLDRSQVTDRILANVKNFEKVDPNKVLLKSVSSLCVLALVPEEHCHFTWKFSSTRALFRCHSHTKSN